MWVVVPFIIGFFIGRLKKKKVEAWPKTYCDTFC